MSRLQRPVASCSMNWCVIPAPAPWAKTKHARARGGWSNSAETAFTSSIRNFSFCAPMAVMSRNCSRFRRNRPSSTPQLENHRAARSLPQCRMIPEQVVADRGRLNRAEQYPCGVQVVGRDAQGDDLAQRGIAQQIIGDLDRDLHRGPGGALIALVLVFSAPVTLPPGGAADFFRTPGCGTADVANPVRRLDVA